jgi:lipoate---protein ligase
LLTRIALCAVGYSQDPAQELDLAQCRQTGLPVFRREVGGGAVYLDRDQIFWQVVLSRDNPLASLNRQKLYARFLAPVAAVYRELGVEVGLRPINDLAVGHRRIAGTGAGEIGDCVVFVGNIMRSFDCAAMARAIRSPDLEFRQSYQCHMENHLTSLRRELGSEREAATPGNLICNLLAREFEKVMGTLEPASPDRKLRGEAEKWSVWGIICSRPPGHTSPEKPSPTAKSR